MTVLETTCNSCGARFDVSPLTIKTVTADGLEIKYFVCPECGRKYTVLATDQTLRRLIDRRAALRKAIAQAHKHNFRSKTIKRYEKVKEQQPALAAALKARGQATLDKLDN